MNDDIAPPQPIFPNYPLGIPGQQIASAKQAKPLFKILNKTLANRFNKRISPVKKGLASKRKKKEI